MSVIEGVEMGWKKPYLPETSAEALLRYGPPVASSQRGLSESVIYKMQVATDNVNPGFKEGDAHLDRINRGIGTLFETSQERVLTDRYRKQGGQPPRRTEAMWLPEQVDIAESQGISVEEHFTKVIAASKGGIASLPTSDRDAILKQWVGGQYVGPSAVKQGDTLGEVERGARKNETYLPEDMRRFESRLRSLIPAEMMKPKPGTVKAPL